MFGLEKDRLISNQPNVYEQVGEADIPAQGLWTHLKGFDFVTIFRKQELGNDIIFTIVLINDST